MIAGNTYTIYGVNVIGKSDIIYVGCTGHALKDRLSQLKSANKVLRHLRGLLVIRPLLTVPKRGRFDKERQVILKYKKLGGCQANDHTKVRGKTVAKELAAGLVLPPGKRIKRAYQEDYYGCSCRFTARTKRELPGRCLIHAGKAWLSEKIRLTLNLDMGHEIFRHYREFSGGRYVKIRAPKPTKKREIVYG